MDEIVTHHGEEDERSREAFASRLTTAVKENNILLVKYLIDNGASATEADGTGIPPLYRAITHNNLLMLQEILDIVPIHDVVAPNGDTPLVHAIRNGSILEIIHCLLSHGADINDSTTTKTPLSWAVQSSNTNTVEFLLNYGADINQVGRDGNTALGTAVRFNKTQAIKLLIERRADIEKCDEAKGGRSPLSWAICSADVEIAEYLMRCGALFNDALFLQAIATKDLRIVRYLTDYKGAQVTRREYNVLPTPLMKAVDSGSIEIVEFLINNGARVVEDLYYDEINVIMDLISCQNFSLAELLMENGARIDEFGSNGETLLTLAAKCGSFPMVKYLTHLDVNPNKPNARGEKPLLIAAQCNDFQVFQYLMSANAVLTDEELQGDTRASLYYLHGVENLEQKKT